MEEDELDNEIPEGEEEEVRIKFKLFESYPRYGMLKNLMFDDDTKTFGEIEPGAKPRQTRQSACKEKGPLKVKLINKEFKKIIINVIRPL